MLTAFLMRYKKYAVGLVATLVTLTIVACLFSFIDKQRIAPSLALQSPLPNAADVLPDKIIELHYDKKIDQQSLSTLNFEPSFSYQSEIKDEKNIVITPDVPLILGTTYIVNFSPTSFDWLRKDPESLSFSFTTISQPTVLHIEPSTLGAAPIVTNQPITISFSSPLARQYVVYQLEPFINLELVWNSSNTIVTITGNYSPSTTYSFKLQSEANTEQVVVSQWLLLDAPLEITFTTTPEGVVPPPIDTTSIDITPESEELFYEALNEVINNNPTTRLTNLLPYEDEYCYIDYDTELDMYLVYLKGEETESHKKVEQWFIYKGILDISKLHIYWISAP
jgi:hypothetical protein